MWKVLPFVLLLKISLAQNLFQLDDLSDDVANKLRNLQEQRLKLLAKIPDAAWIINRNAPRTNNRQISLEPDPSPLNLTTDDFINFITGNVTDKYNLTDVIKFKFTINKCYLDLIYLMFHPKESWTVQMLDAAGKLPAGLERGNLHWMGDFTECRNVAVPPKDSGNITFGDFRGQYCSMSLGTGQMELSMNVGFCVPNSCSEDLLADNFKILKRFLNYTPIAMVKKIEKYINNTQITCQSSERKWESSHIAYMCILSIFIALIVAGTLCDIIEVYKKRKLNKLQESHYSSRETVNAYDTSNENGKFASTEESDDINPLIKKSDRESSVVEFLICFSIYTNGAKILSVENTSDQLRCIHGIRFLSMCWIILGHTFISDLAVIDNLVDILDFAKKFIAMFIIQATYSVDTFFLLSGFLLSYLFLKKNKETNESINWLYYYLHRFWRLTPTLAMVLGFYTTIWLHTASGPFWPTVTENGHCDKYWWMNLLYIQNFISNSKMCMAWTWYLANDMQFYVISPLFLILLTKYSIVGIIVIYVTLSISIITTGVLGTQTNMITIFSSLDEPNVTFTQNDSGNWFDDIYDKPYCRIGPYLVGILTGYIFHNVKSYKSFFKTRNLTIGWIIALGFSSSVIFGIYHAHLGVVVASIYNTFSRTTWSIAVAWVIFACLSGYGGFVNTILSWKAWIPLSRLTYSAYLIHLIIMSTYFSSILRPVHFTLDSMIVYFFAFLIATYLTAFVVSVAFESSTLALEKFVLKRVSKK